MMLICPVCKKQEVLLAELRERLARLEKTSHEYWKKLNDAERRAAEYKNKLAETLRKGKQT